MVAGCAEALAEARPGLRLPRGLVWPHHVEVAWCRTSAPGPAVVQACSPPHQRPIQAWCTGRLVQEHQRTNSHETLMKASWPLDALLHQLFFLASAPHFLPRPCTSSSSLPMHQHFLQPPHQAYTLSSFLCPEFSPCFLCSSPIHLTAPCTMLAAPIPGLAPPSTPGFIWLPTAVHQHQHQALHHFRAGGMLEANPVNPL